MSRKPAKRKPQARRTSKSSTPGWAWLLIGILVGVLAAQIDYIQLIHSFQVALKEREKASSETQMQAKSHSKTALPAKTHKTKFDFYTILPNKTENTLTSAYQTLPSPIEKPSTSKEQKPSALTHSKLNEEGATTLKAIPALRTSYVLQVTSVRHYKEADRYKAQLLMLGLQDVVVQKFKRKGVTWYRVIVGRYSTRSQAAEALNQLKQKHVKSIIIKAEENL